MAGKLSLSYPIKSLLCILMVFVLNPSGLYPCTGITAPVHFGILLGSNEDYNQTFKDTFVRIRPAVDGKYGLIETGFKRHDYFMIGMNDQGLLIDMFTVPKCYEWIDDPAKLDYPGQLERKMLTDCATVDEVVDLLKIYNNSSMGTYPYQILAADSTGDAAVISWTDGGIEVVHKDRDYFVLTNFYLRHPKCGWHPCWRYNTAQDRMKNAQEYTFNLFGEVLQEVNLDSNYSQISNLTQKTMYIFNNHNFDEFLTLDLIRALQKGYHELELPDYFSRLKLLSPADSINIHQSGRIPLQWQGEDSSQYQVLYSQNPDFSTAQSVIVMGHQQFFSKAHLTLGMLTCMLFLVFFFKSLKIRSVFLISCLILLFLPFNSCQVTDSNNPIVTTHTHILENLQPSTVYYWKVMATKHPDLKTESITRSFKTAES